MNSEKQATQVVDPPRPAPAPRPHVSLGLDVPRPVLKGSQAGGTSGATADSRRVPLPRGSGRGGHRYRGLHAAHERPGGDGGRGSDERRVSGIFHRRGDGHGLHRCLWKTPGIHPIDGAVIFLVLCSAEMWCGVVCFAVLVLVVDAGAGAGVSAGVFVDGVGF